MTKQQNTTKKTKHPKTKNQTKGSPRVRKIPHYQSFKMSKTIKNVKPALPKARQILVSSLKDIIKNRRAVLGITAIYAGLYLLLVRSLTGGVDLSLLKDLISESTGGLVGQGGLALGLFSYLVSGEGVKSDQLTNMYQAILVIIMSLALIYVFRRSRTGEEISLRDSFYKGMYPLIPFVLVIMVMALQLVPAIVGNAIYSIVIDGGLAVTAVERVWWAVFYGLAVVLSLYMLSSSVFALYIATLANMTPMKALRSARNLVLHRRFEAIRKIIFIGVVSFLVMAGVVIPIIIVAPALAEWAFLLLSIGGFGLIHGYMYSLYRELLK